MTLSEAIPGVTYEILSIIGSSRNRLAEMGFNQGCEILVKRRSSYEYFVINCRGFQIAMKKSETDCVLIQEINNTKV